MRLVCVFIMAMCALIGHAGAEVPDSLCGSRMLSHISWKRMGVTVGAGLALRLSIDAILKNNVHEMRPDRSGNNSFPSRHSTWAFGIATRISYRLGEMSPWWAVASHAGASGVGMQRVIASKHYAGDVMAGAGIGALTSVLSYKIADWIFGSEHTYSGWRECDNAMSRSLEVVTAASFPFNKCINGCELATALRTTLRLNMPVSDRLSVTASGMLSSAPLRVSEAPLKPLNSISALAGAEYHIPFASCRAFAVDIGADAGVNCYLDHKSADVRRWAPMVAVRTDLSAMLTRRLAVGATIGYDFTYIGIDEVDNGLSSISVGFFSRACF